MDLKTPTTSSDRIAIKVWSHAKGKRALIDFGSTTVQAFAHKCVANHGIRAAKTLRGVMGAMSRKGFAVQVKG